MRAASTSACTLPLKRPYLSVVGLTAPTRVEEEGKKEGQMGDGQDGKEGGGG